MKSLHEKLANIQGRLKAPKNQRNNFGKYNYRSCEDILEAVKPLLNENGLDGQVKVKLQKANEKILITTIVDQFIVQYFEN